MNEVLVRYISVARSTGQRGVRDFTIGAFQNHFPEIKMENLNFDNEWFSREDTDQNFLIYFKLVMGDSTNYDVVTE